MIFKIIAFLVVGGVFAIFILYNNQIKERFLSASTVIDKKLSNSIGKRLKRQHETLESKSKINSKSFYNSISNFYDDILIHLGLKKNGVNILSFLFFILVLAVILSVIVFIFIQDILLCSFLVGVFFIFLTVMFKFIALTRYEQVEEMMMEAQDLIAMGVDVGVKNAITRYTPSLHPSIRPYFESFLRNIDTEGYSFREAMFKLNDDLGDSFNSFARAAIEYESKGDVKTKEVFAPIIDENEVKRGTRAMGNKAFATIRMYYFGSVAVTVSFGAYLILSERSAYDLMLNTSFGRILLVIDVTIIILVLAFITTIKAKLLK